MGARAVPLKQRDEADIRSAASLFVLLYGASLVGAAAGPASRGPRGHRKVKQLKERTDSSQIGAV